VEKWHAFFGDGRDAGRGFLGLLNVLQIAFREILKDLPLVL
jgi:hypothetical protein